MDAFWKSSNATTTVVEAFKGLTPITIEYVLKSQLGQVTGRKKDLTNINSLTGSTAKKPQGSSSLSIS